MGEATLVVMLTGFGWYVWRKHREANWGPNFYNDSREVWTGWHVICFMSGSIVLPGLVRFIA
jgi:nicotinamide riboside transporter PnuC